MRQQINVGIRAVIAAGGRAEERKAHNAGGFQLRCVFPQGGYDLLPIHAHIVTQVFRMGQCCSTELDTYSSTHTI